MSTIPTEPIPNPDLPPGLPPDLPQPPIEEPEPDVLPDEVPNPNPDENDKPPKHMEPRGASAFQNRNATRTGNRSKFLEAGNFLQSRKIGIQSAFKDVFGG